MEKEKVAPMPGYIKILAWLISLSAFAIGFWHTHLGLKEFKPLSWEYGSLVVSGLVLMVLIVAYNRAIVGVKYAILIYLLCATFMFVFNLNSFYPNFKGKQLIKEDASMLKDSLSKYTTYLNDLSGGKDKSKTFQTVGELKTLQKQIYTELTDPNHVMIVGPFVRGYFDKFKTISGENTLSLGSISNSKFDPATKMKTINLLNAQLDSAILNFVARQSPGDKSALEVAQAAFAMDALSKKYSDSLTKITQDTSSIISPEIARKGADVMMMVKIASEFDQISRKVNTAKKQTILPIFTDNEKNQVSIPYTQQLGLFSHTISAIFKHLNKIDTWGIIILCLFIDFIVPLSMFVMLRNVNDDPKKPNKTDAFDFNSKK
jgi:hypothetical protein